MRRDNCQEHYSSRLTKAPLFIFLSYCLPQVVLEVFIYAYLSVIVFFLFTIHTLTTSPDMTVIR